MFLLTIRLQMTANGNIEVWQTYTARYSISPNGCNLQAPHMCQTNLKSNSFQTLSATHRCQLCTPRTKSRAKFIVVRHPIEHLFAILHGTSDKSSISRILEVSNLLTKHWWLHLAPTITLPYTLPSCTFLCTAQFSPFYTRRANEKSWSGESQLVSECDPSCSFAQWVTCLNLHKMHKDTYNYKETKWCTTKCSPQANAMQEPSSNRQQKFQISGKPTCHLIKLSKHGASSGVRTVSQPSQAAMWGSCTLYKQVHGGMARSQQASPGVTRRFMGHVLACLRIAELEEPSAVPHMATGWIKRQSYSMVTWPGSPHGWLEFHWQLWRPGRMGMAWAQWLTFGPHSNILWSTATS